MFCQCTLAESVAAVGIGLHSGRKIRLVLHPAPEDSGIVFRRVDLNPPVDIPAAPMNVNDTRMATTVNVGRAAVATIEHLMSAFSGLGVDNCLVEVNAPEIPVMDGSGAAFVYLIHSAGLVEQKAPRRFVRILKPLRCAKAANWLGWNLTKASGCRFALPSVIRRSTLRINMLTLTFPKSTMNRPYRGAGHSGSFRMWKCFAKLVLRKAAHCPTPSSWMNSGCSIPEGCANKVNL